MILKTTEARVPANIVNWRNSEVKQNILDNKALDWRALFGNTNPIDLEIGIGNGSFLVPFCSDNSTRNMIGVEIEGLYLKKADKRLSKENLGNGKLLIGDAKLLIWKLVPELALENVYINYPDPWFKKRHKKRRMVNPWFLQMIATKMNSVLTVATDDEEYRDWVVECIKESDCFAPIFDDIWVSHLPGYYQTKYEKKWKDLGKAVFYMKFNKVRHPGLDANEYIETQNLQFPLKKLEKERMATIGLKEAKVITKEIV